MTDLSKEERRVIEQCGTEPRFSSDLLNMEEDGVFKCKKCGQKLFSTEHKFDSGTGWPSFFDELENAEISRNEDNSLGTVRTEAVCSNCGAHLGHIFEDGPEPTGERYCINGIALEFEPE